MASCYLCGIAEPEVIRTKLRHNVQRNVLRCPSCTLVWLEPKQADLQEYYRDEYRRTYTPVPGKQITAEETFAMYRPFMADRIHHVRPHVDSSMRALEIGSASGYFLDALRPFVREVVGLEFNESHADYARQRLGIEMFSVPIEQTGLPKESLDIVFVFHVLEHVPDPVGFLQGLSPYLSSGGKIYIEVPNVDDALLSSYEVQGFADFYYREPHLFYFSPTTLRTVTGRAGFVGEIEMVQRYGLANHIHWVTTGTPQPDAQTALGVPKFVPNSAVQRSAFEVELQEWLGRTDSEYRTLLKRHSRAEAMTFVGTRRNAA